ncbi:hypothetical protein SAMN05421686_101374 [Thalassolituus maritimus]|uniref:Uncharacterized protein n=1 Tax=Thalassolituus maritimus TaxID=484498 RepID=A0A1N7J5L4_9GAMM|nr:hypothetical protein SAMN05421686_101374 [Thalassolituus maritimus]
MKKRQRGRNNTAQSFMEAERIVLREHSEKLCNTVVATQLASGQLLSAS